MTRRPILTIVVALFMVVACVGVTAVAVQGRSDAEDREQAAVEREQDAVDRLPGHGSVGERLAGPAASHREDALRAYFDPDVLGALNLLGTAAGSSACAAASSGQAVTDQTAQGIVDEVATTTDLPALVALPDDEWRAMLGTDFVEEELARCGP